MLKLCATRPLAPLGLGQSGRRFQCSEENKSSNCPNITSTGGRNWSGMAHSPVALDRAGCK